MLDPNDQNWPASLLEPATEYDHRFPGYDFKQNVQAAQRKKRDSNFDVRMTSHLPKSQLLLTRINQDSNCTLERKNECIRLIAEEQVAAEKRLVERDKKIESIDAEIDRLRERRKLNERMNMEANVSTS